MSISTSAALIIGAAIAAAAPGEDEAHREALPRTPITFAAAVELAARSPLVTGLDAGLREKERRDRDVSSVPGNPEITVSPGLRFSRDVSPDFEPEVSVMQPLSLSGLGGARREAAASETAALAAELAASRQEHHLAGARAWIELWAVEHELALSEKELEVARELTRVTRLAFEAGAATAADVQEALAYEAELELETLRREGTAFERSHALAEVAGYGPEVELTAAGELPIVEVDDAALAVALRAIDHLPTIAAAKLAAEVEVKKDAELEAQHGWSGAIGVTVARDAPDSVLALAELRVVPPVFERGARDRAAAGARRARAEATYHAEKRRAAQSLATIFHEVRHSREEEALEKARVVPAARELARLRELEVRGGTATVVDLLRARRAAIAAERALLLSSAGRAFAELRAQIILDALVKRAGAEP